MRTFRVVACLLVVMLPWPALAQRSKLPKRPMANAMAITGTASTAKHCVSGTSSNVHGLGWIQQGSRVTVSFESDFDPIAAVVTFAIDVPGGDGGYLVDDDSGGNLEPELSYTAPMSGNTALYVSGYRSTSGCYWYRLEVVSPLGSAVQPRPAGAPKDPAIHPAAITGLPSASYHCIAGDAVANVHSIGRVTAGARITVTFDTDFDAVAGVTNLDLFAAVPSAVYSYDDDSGGRLAPEIRLTIPDAGTLALFVGGYRSVAGCYRYKVEIQ